MVVNLVRVIMVLGQNTGKPFFPKNLCYFSFIYSPNMYNLHIEDKISGNISGSFREIRAELTLLYNKYGWDSSVMRQNSALYSALRLYETFQTIGFKESQS